MSGYTVPLHPETVPHLTRICSEIDRLAHSPSPCCRFLRSFSLSELRPGSAAFANPSALLRTESHPAGFLFASHIKAIPEARLTAAPFRPLPAHKFFETASFLHLQSVSNPRNCLDDILKIQLLANPSHMRIDRPRLSFKLYIPECIEQLLAG